MTEIRCLEDEIQRLEILQETFLICKQKADQEMEAFLAELVDTKLRLIRRLHEEEDTFWKNQDISQVAKGEFNQVAKGVA